jgi:transposase-like protein
MNRSKNNYLSSLWIAGPAEARALCESALSGERSIGEAAKALGVSCRTLLRWIAKHQLTNRHARKTKARGE